MKPLSMRDIARVTGADYTGPADAAVTNVSTDTRSLPAGCVFVALAGDSFDGNDFVGRALEQGAAWAVAQRCPPDCPPERVLIVEDGRRALLAIARLYRESLDVKVAAVTGTVGKTTTKEMTACVLSAAYPTHKTPLNLNNEIGLSHTILQLEPHHRAAVLEMGMDGPGQMAPLSICARPDVAIITNIGVTHMEKLGSRENILREKFDVTAGMRGGTLILNGDDALLSTITGGPFGRILRYGLDRADADARAVNITADSTDTSFQILYNGNCFDARIPCLGLHNVGNALAAFLAGMCLGIAPEDAANALGRYEPAGMRQKIVNYHGFTVVEDCYNAGPESMRAALRTLGGLACSGRRIAVLSDMLELGDGALAAHRDTGRAAAEAGVDALLCTGALSAAYPQGAAQAGLRDAWHFDSQEALWQRLKAMLRPGDIVWFKASRGMRLESVVQKVYEEC